MSDKVQKDFDTFFLTFVGQKITITSDLILPNAEYPVYFEGILLDFDDTYLYLGKNPIEIDQAVKKKNIVHIVVLEEQDVYNEVLKQMPGPENDEEVN